MKPLSVEMACFLGIQKEICKYKQCVLCYIICENHQYFLALIC